MSGNTTEVKVGQTYKLIHTRFGKAVVTVTAIQDSTWIDVQVKSGILRGMRDEWGAGESKTVRRDHCRFIPVESEG